MIMVEVAVPVLGQKYDFELDETTKVCLLVEEIVEMLCRREKRTLPDHMEYFYLGEMDSGVLMDPEGTLRDYGISDGGRLVLA